MTRLLHSVVVGLVTVLLPSAAVAQTQNLCTAHGCHIDSFGRCFCITSATNKVRIPQIKQLDMHKAKLDPAASAKPVTSTK